MYKVLLLDPYGYSEAAKIRVRQVAILDEKSMTHEQLISEINQYHGIILRFANKIDSEIISRARNLRVIATNATGSDHIDLVAAQERDIRLITLRNEADFLNTISSTAELTWGLILSLIRNLPAAITDVRVGGWRRDLFIGHDLKGRKLGILGLGRIGKMVARYGQVFGMQVKFFDSDKTLFCEALERTNSIEELFSWSDILTVHVPLTAETQGLISKNLINKMQKTSYLINTSRGRIINETDLTAALNSKTISGAALDVLTGEHESEFPKASEIWKYAKTNNNLIITPHIGGATYDSWEKTEFFICDKLSEYLESLVE